MKESVSSSDVGISESHTVGQPQSPKTSEQRPSPEPTSPEFLLELDRLLEIAAGKLPASQQSPRNQRHQRAFERKTRAYFWKLEAAFPYEELAAIYERYAEG